MFEVTVIFGFFVEQVFDVYFYYEIYDEHWNFLIRFENIENVYQWCYEKRKEVIENGSD